MELVATCAPLFLWFFQCAAHSGMSWLGKPCVRRTVQAGMLIACMLAVLVMLCCAVLFAVDTTPPQLVVPSSMVRIEATGQAAANSSGAITGAYLLNLASLVTATDVVAGANVSIVCKKQSDNAVVDASTALGPLGTPVTIVCTATDPSGNSATKSFSVLAGE